jgi:hypothetical protein
MRVNLQGKDKERQMRSLFFTFLALLLLLRAESQTGSIDFQYNNDFKWVVRPERLAVPKSEYRPEKALSQEKYLPSNKSLRLPPNWYARQMAWTCQQEWQWEKTTRLPVRLRLGSKEQVDWLEGKGR